ncbi:MAG: siderophore-interacting protein [Myxococcota bacterium]
MANIKRKVLKGAVTALGSTVTIERIRALSPRLRLLRMQGEAIERMTWAPGDKIKLHVGQGVMRSYTPARVDRAGRSMDVVVHLHGRGPASAWASRLRGGEEVSFFGPARSMAAGLEDEPPWAMFLGDETAIGLAQAMTEACEPCTEIFGAIELHPDDLGAVDALGLPLRAVPRDDDEPGPALVDWLAQTWVPPGDGVVWLSGEASTVLELRTALLERGLSRSQLQIKPYWSMRGAAHRKRLERGALVA